jgi:hypothetical protein
VREALSTLPWVEKGSVVPEVSKQQVRFAVQDKKAFNLAEVKKAIEAKDPNFKVGDVLSGP